MTEPIAVVPVYRLRDVDPALLAESMLEHADTAERDQWAAAFRDKRVRVDAPPDSEYVDVTIDGDRRKRRVRNHR